MNTHHIEEEEIILFIFIIILLFEVSNPESRASRSYYMRSPKSEAPHNKRNRKQRIENKNFNLSETVYSTIHNF